MKILVTGAGSLIGHGVLRSLRKISTRDFTIVTADPDHRAAGHWLGDLATKIPLAKDPTYIDQLVEITNHHDIDLLFIGTDPELILISSNLQRFKCTIVVSQPNVIQLGDDKLTTAFFLRDHGFPFPDSALANDREEVEQLISRVGFPLIAKPRVGARSAGLMRINSVADLGRIVLPDYVVQEYLPDHPGEFTAGTMTYDGKCLSDVIFRRDLKEGNTYRAYTHEDEKHSTFLRKLSEAIPGVYGPLNFQYRVKDGNPVVFEINSRFSGTTPLRTAIGVNEIEMALQYARGGKVLVPNPKLRNVAILRTWSDIIVPMEELSRFEQNGELNHPSATYFPFY